MGLSNAKLFSKMDSEYNCGAFLKKIIIFRVRFCTYCGTDINARLEDKDTSYFYSNNINPIQSFMKQVVITKEFLIRKKTAKLISRLLEQIQKRVQGS